METTQKSGNHSKKVETTQKKWKPLKKKWKPLYEIQTKLGGLHENRNS